MTTVELFVSALCPYAQRARLVVAEKAIAAAETAVDLRAKPASFLALSPNGKVPLLVHDGRLVWDAAVIGEYLDEAFPDRPLMPASPYARARARMWIRFADARLYERTERLLHSTDPAVHAQLTAALAEDLLTLESQALAHPERDGPYWLGAQFSLADIAFYPWFEQISVLERYRGLRPPDNLRRLQAWKQAVAERRAVLAVARPEAYYLEAYGRLAALQTATAG